MTITTAETVIIGGGVMGCSIAYNLAARGMTGIVLLERDALGSGATGRSMASVHTHFSTPTLVHIAWQSLQVYRGFKDLIGGECGFTETGHLVFAGKNHHSATVASVALQKEAGMETSIINNQDASEIAPGLNLDDGAAIAYGPLAGHADASGTALAYASQARQLGVRIELRCPATSLHLTGRRVTAVDTGRGRISTSSVIVATGAWSRGFLAPLGFDLPLRAIRHEVAGFEGSMIASGKIPGASDTVNQIYFRREGANLLLAASSSPSSPQDDILESESEPTTNDPAAFGGRPSQSSIASIWNRLKRRIPAIEHAKYTTGFAGLFTSTPDNHPVMGRIGGIDGLYLCAGFGLHGINLAPAVGTAMAELVSGGNAPSIDISSFALSRFQSEMEVPRTVGEVLNVIV